MRRLTLPPEVTADMPNWPATMWSTFDFTGWTGPDWKWPPHTFYALWKYAQAFGGAKTIFDSAKTDSGHRPAMQFWLSIRLRTMPGSPAISAIWNCSRLAGYPEDAAKRATLESFVEFAGYCFRQRQSARTGRAQ